MNEPNWRNKTLEALEKDCWTLPKGASYLVRRVHELRKLPLNEFSIEDLRIMIGQQFSLEYLVPLAIEVLKEDLFAEGDFYEGDLLKSVLQINADYWISHENYWKAVKNLIQNRRDEIIEKGIETLSFDNCRH